MVLAGVAVLFLAGCCDMIGQSVVLFVNRVPLRRFGLSLAANGLFLVFTAALWTVTIWLIAGLWFKAHRPFPDVLAVVGLAHAPLLLSALAVIPYFGNLLYHGLRIWVLMGLVVGAGSLFNLSFGATLVCCSTGWVVNEVLTHLKLFSLDRVQDWIWTAVTGTGAPPPR